MDVDELQCFAVIVHAAGIIMELLAEEEEGNAKCLEKTGNFAEYTVMNFNDKQFKEHFRLNRTTFEILLTELQNDNTPVVQAGQPALPLEKQLLMTLWCLANIECFRSVADRFGVGKGCCWQILYRTCHRLLRLNQRCKIISFPNQARATEIANDFERRSGFPGIIGAIDGCHIRILKPVDHPNSYINRKGFPSVLLQGICDNRKLFLDVYAGEPGSLHDARLLAKSDIHERILNGEIEFPNNTHLIGDLAYPLSTTLMVGFKDNGNLTEAQKLFNQKISQSRIVIENAFGILKGRFRRLKFLETKRLDLIALLIVASCILHNLCILHNDFYEGQVEEEEEEAHIPLLPNINPAVEAVAKRRNIMNDLYNRLR